MHLVQSESGIPQPQSHQPSPCHVGLQVHVRGVSRQTALLTGSIDAQLFVEQEPTSQYWQ